MTNPAEKTKKTGRGTQFLMDIAEAVTSRLIEEKLAPELCLELGLIAAERVQEIYGADAIYVPSGFALRISRRDQNIFEKFTGDNYFALAKEYNLTVRQIYTIVARVRAANFARQQMKLFDD